MHQMANEAPVLSEMNTTPLIDVLLVLLIMFIITIPPQSHAVKLDLPQGPPPVLDRPHRDKNKIVVTADDRILWNGAAVDAAGLRYQLNRMTTLSPEPELHLQPDPQARYARVDEVLAITRRANVSAMGFVGNEAYARW